MRQQITYGDRAPSPHIPCRLSHHRLPVLGDDIPHRIVEAQVAAFDQLKYRDRDDGFRHRCDATDGRFVEVARCFSISETEASSLDDPRAPSDEEGSARYVTGIYGALKDFPGRAELDILRLANSRSAHPFTAPEVIPVTICLLKKMYMMSGGIVIRTMFVNSRFQELRFCAEKLKSDS